MCGCRCAGCDEASLVSPGCGGPAILQQQPRNLALQLRIAPPLPLLELLLVSDSRKFEGRDLELTKDRWAVPEMTTWLSSGYQCIGSCFNDGFASFPLPIGQ